MSQSRPVKRQKLPGKPEWFKALWEGSNDQGRLRITPQKSVAPSLYRMMWYDQKLDRAFPLYHDATHKWGYLVPNDGAMTTASGERAATTAARHRKAVSACLVSPLPFFFPEGAVLSPLSPLIQLPLRPPPFLVNHVPPNTGLELPWEAPNGLDDHKRLKFFKLPHKSGEAARCGSPFSKDYISYIEKGTLQTQYPEVRRRPGK